MEIETTYRYERPDGTLAYEVVRFVPKSFRPRMPDGTYGLKAPRILYRLPQLNTEGFVWVCEGEKDADNLAAFGLVTTTAGASKSWAATDTTPLHGAWGVVIIPDCDDAGKFFGLTAANDLFTHVKSVQILDLGGSKGYDLSDYLEDNGSQALMTLRSNTPKYHPERKKQQHGHRRGHKRGRSKVGTPGLPYNIDDLAWELGGERQHGNSRVVYCPAHDDEGGTPGLSLTAMDDEHTLAYCHSGCDFLEIARAVEERME